MRWQTFVENSGNAIGGFWITVKFVAVDHKNGKERGTEHNQNSSFWQSAMQSNLRLMESNHYAGLRDETARF